jgi:hypothetical protein
MIVSKTITAIYYDLKPMIPRRLQIALRRAIILRNRNAYSHVWPILEEAGKSPNGWPGWPDQKQFALILTHDVDTARGQQTCRKLMKLEVDLGFRSSFNFVPERYPVSYDLRADLVNNGFEVGVHGLNHDGKLFRSRKIFNERSTKINNYLKHWKAVGFRSPAMHHNLEWIHDLEIQYDMSTFDTDPYEPQSDGVSTIFPFWVEGTSNQNGYAELPYTLPQDFTIFVLMRQKTIDVWKNKLQWIAKKGGMALLNTHPDYMKFSTQKLRIEEYPVEYYRRFLQYVKSRFQYQYWHALPREIAAYVSKHPLNINQQCISEKRR